MDTGNNTAGKTAPERYVSEKAFEELPDTFQKLAELLGEDQFELVAVNDEKDQYKDSCQCKTHTCKNDLTCRICRIHLHQTVSCLDQRDRTPPEETADAGKRCHHPVFF